MFSSNPLEALIVFSEEAAFFTEDGNYIGRQWIRKRVTA